MYDRVQGPRSGALSKGGLFRVELDMIFFFFLPSFLFSFLLSLFSEHQDYHNILISNLVNFCKPSTLLPVDVNLQSAQAGTLQGYYTTLRHRP